MSTELMVKQFDGSNIFFMEDGWFNATSAAKAFGKRPEDWLRLNSTKEYIAVILEEFSVTGFPVTEMQVIDFVKVRRGKPENGGGTWLHPELAVEFARWCDVKFARWCDKQIDIILKSGINDPMRDPFPVLFHPVYGFPVVSLAEDITHKQVRNSYIEVLNHLGLRAPIYKQTLTNNVSRILIGMPIRPFRRLFGIPAGSTVRTRLFMDWNLRRATSRIEETACFMISGDNNIHTFAQVEDVVYQVAKIVYQQHLSRGLTLGENVPEELLLG